MDPSPGPGSVPASLPPLLLQQVVESSADALLFIDRSRVVRFVNSAAERLFGVSRSELIGSPWRPSRWVATLADGRPVPDSEKGDLRAIELGSSSPCLERRITRADGTSVVVSGNTVPLLDDAGQVVGVVATFTDISSRVRAEQELRESELRYRSLFEENLAGVFRSTMTGEILDCNDAFAQVFGFESRAEILACNTHDFDRSAGDREKFDLALRSHGRLRNYESPMRDRHGRPIWILENVTLRDGVQEGTVIDVTELKRVEEQLRQALKMEAIGQLAGGVAHDFNNLLTVILGNISIVCGMLPEESPALELMKDGERAAWRAAEMTTKLLTFARRDSAHFEIIQLDQIVTDAIGLLKRTIDPRILIELDLEPNLWPVHADSTQLHQLVLNLCVNARDAMPEGGQLSLVLQNVMLRPEDLANHREGTVGEFVCLAVSDTGVGIPKNALPHIFEPYFTTKDVGKGTGLGLALVFSIVKRHNGWIECSSTVGIGTTFEIYLPRTRLNRSAEPVLEPPSTGGNETILLVDDEPLVSSLAGTILRQHGYTVFTASDGIEALEWYEREGSRVDLVLLDMTMPRLSGRDTFAGLKLLNPSVRVLFSSGYAAEHLTSEEAASAAGFVSKPYRPKDLVRAVRTAIDSR